MNTEIFYQLMQVREQLSEPTRLRSYRTENIVALIDTQLQNWIENLDAAKANSNDGNIPF